MEALWRGLMEPALEHSRVSSHEFLGCWVESSRGSLTDWIQLLGSIEFRGSVVGSDSMLTHFGPDDDSVERRHHFYARRRSVLSADGESSDRNPTRALATLPTRHGNASREFAQD